MSFIYVTQIQSAINQTVAPSLTLSERFENKIKYNLNMNNKYLLYSIFIVIFTGFHLVAWPRYFTKRERNARIQRLVL